MTSLKNEQQQFENFERLKYEQEKFLSYSKEKINQWQKFKDDYLTLRTRLETLPHELKHDVMVPISKVAFMPGKLINTNEILVLLGENWFVEKSAHKACELIDRRLASIDNHLVELRKENDIFNSQLEWTSSLLNEKREFVNIEEKLDDVKTTQKVEKKTLSESEKRELRRTQQEKAARFQLEIDSELKKAASRSIEDNEDESEELKEPQKDTFMDQLASDVEKLDMGEKFEELTGPLESHTELKSMLVDYEKGIDRENNEKMRKVIESRCSEQKKKEVKWNVDVEKEDSDDYEVSDEEESENENEQGDCENKPARIFIKHTQSEKVEELLRNQRVSRDKDEINSPGDIYTHFFKPKSILKKNTSSRSSPDKTSVTPISNNANMKLNESNEKFEPLKVSNDSSYGQSSNRD